MLNNKKERELAYLVKVDDIRPMDADRLEAVVIGGWNCVCSKGTFKKGDLGIFFEIDSKLPETAPYTEMEFLKSKHYKIKSQRIRGVVSQGLLLHPTDLGWTIDGDKIIDEEGKQHTVNDESRFLTELLNVTYAVHEDNKRKASDNNLKYQSMMARKKELFKKPWARWLMRREWGRKVMFFIFGKKKDNPRGFPKGFPYVHKTDEERVENMAWILEDKSPLIVTEKLDGTSCTYILEKKLFGRYEFYVSSRNVRQLDPRQETYFNQTGIGTGNIYWDLAFKYDIENKLKRYLKENPHLKYVCIQGEGVGHVQGNPLKLDEDDLYVFNFIQSDVGRINSVEGQAIVKAMGMKWVPIVMIDYVLPDTMEDFKIFADGPSVVNPNVMREGYVLRNPVTDVSFKNVSRQYLLSKKD